MKKCAESFRNARSKLYVFLNTAEETKRCRKLAGEETYGKNKTSYLITMIYKHGDRLFLPMKSFSVQRLAFYSGLYR